MALTVSLSLFLTGAGLSSAQASPGPIGVMVDAGVPDGVTGSLVLRPFRPVHIHAGVGSNLISYGVRAGASVYLLPFAVSPTLSGEVGRYFPGDANDAANRFGLAADSDSPLLREVGYDYANLHLGLDFGRERFSFYIHAGFSALRGEVRHLDEFVAQDADSSLQFEVTKNATVNIVAPSARIGFLFFF